MPLPLLLDELLDEDLDFEALSCRWSPSCSYRIDRERREHRKSQPSDPTDRHEQPLLPP
jgi:hypothetical protein